MKSRRFRSFAKINLGLEVVGRLPDGYHALKTLFATISLHDIVEIGQAKGGVRIWCDDPDAPADHTNLAHRAAVLMRRLAGKRTGVSIRLFKRIPVGGGLGGGSSNAATVLRALDLIWGLGLGPKGLLDAARSLGADVPYFLVGGPALGLARGDEIHPSNFSPREKVVLVPGRGGVSTAAVFQRFRLPKKSPRRSSIDAFLRAIEGGPDAGAPAPFRLLRNDLEKPAQEVDPRLAGVRRNVQRIGRRTGALQAAMSGSGSSFFLLFRDAQGARGGATALREAGIPGVRCSFVSHRAYHRRFEINASGH